MLSESAIVVNRKRPPLLVVPLIFPVHGGKDVRSMSQAWDLWDKVLADPRIAFLAEPESLDPVFRRHSRQGSRSPKVWADAYLLAFASAAGLKLVTFDLALMTRREEVLVLE